MLGTEAFIGGYEYEFIKFVGSPQVILHTGYKLHVLQIDQPGYFILLILPR